MRPPDIISALRTVLERYERYSGHLHVPGDWGERAFRGWLVIDVLIGVLGWPSEQVVMGEVFDVLLIDDTLRPVVNVETKKPGHQVSERELTSFKARLPIYGTLEVAYLTNGSEWIRLDLLSPRGNQEIIAEHKLDIRPTRPANTAPFFEPLGPSRYKRR